MHQGNEQAPRPFHAVLSELREGKTLSELTDGFENIIKAVRETGRGGAVTFTLTIDPVKGTDGTMVEMKDTVKVKMPEKRTSTVFFTNAKNGVQRHDPKQDDLFPAVTVVRQPQEQSA